MVRIAAVMLAAMLLAAPAHAEMVRKESAHSVPDTVQRLQAAVKERGLMVFTEIDHAAGAKKAGLELRPTVLVIFGSPVSGTPLMQAEQTMGLSLPLKALAWQDAAGKVWLGYDTPKSVAAERGVGDHAAVARIAGALGAITDAVVKP